MKTIKHIILITLAIAANRSPAQDKPLFPKGEKSPDVHHVGNVWLTELNAPDSVILTNQ